MESSIIPRRGAALVQVAVDFVAADFAVERRAFDTEDIGRLALVPAGGIERGEDVAALDFIQRDRLEGAGLRQRIGRVAGG